MRHHERWRVGRKLGRTIYVIVGDEPSEADILIGMMDTPQQAQFVCQVVNQWLQGGGDSPDVPESG